MSRLPAHLILEGSAIKRSLSKRNNLIPVELFGVSQARLDLLNQAAPTFLRIVQDSLWKDVLLHIARLTDPPHSAGKPNLTVRRLPALIESENASQTVSIVIDDAVRTCDFCRDWRNRWIAHQEFDLALSQPVAPLKTATRKRVKEALASISTVLNPVLEHYTEATTACDVCIVSGGASSLLFAPEDALNALNARKDREERIDFALTGWDEPTTLNLMTADSVTIDRAGLIYLSTKSTPFTSRATITFDLDQLTAHLEVTERGCQLTQHLGTRGYDHCA